MFFDKTENTWCKYQKANINGVKYVDKPGIHIAVKNKIFPVFRDLSKPELLVKCLHEKIQNNSECLNGVIWKRLPKDVFVARKTLEIGICSAVIHFNDGAVGFTKLMKALCLSDGYLTDEYCLRTDHE